MTLQELAIKITIDDKASSEIDGISTGAITKANLIASAFEKAVSAIQSAASSVAGFVKSAVSAYSEYEQLVGGAETLFKGAADEVVEDAKNAYETAGISANQYLQQVNSFAAGLVDSIAKARVGINNTAQDIKKATTELKRANQDAVTAESRRLSDMLEETRRSLQDEYDARAQAYADEEEALRKSQAEEIETFKAGVDFKVQLMVDEYNAKVKLIDDELQARLAAIDAELAALDREDKAQDEATKKRERSRKLEALQEALEYAGSIDERMAAQDALNKYLEKIRDEDAKSSRKTRREQLQQERKDAIDEANNKKDDLKDQYDQQIKAFQEQQAILLKQLQESQAKQLDEMQRAHKDALKELQRANSDQIKEIQRGNEDALRELRNRNTDQEAANKESLQSSEEYVQKTREDYHEAARLSKMAVVDMADNANKMGTDLSRLQDAYQGFNRGEFRMLDNLKLGYGGTKGEMQELLDYAEELAAQQGETADYSIDSFADIIEAIHRVQGELGASGYEYDVLKQKIEDQTLSERELRRVAEDLFLSEKNGYKDIEEAVADVTKRYKDGTLDVDEALILSGTTSYEASQTIQGALNAAKGAWENWLISLSDPNGDVDKSTTELVDKIGIALDLILPRVGEVLDNVLSLIQERGPEIMQKIGDTIWNALPEEWQQRIQEFVDGFDKIVGAVGLVAAALGTLTAAGGIVDIMNIFSALSTTVIPSVTTALAGATGFFGDMGAAISLLGESIAGTAAGVMPFGESLLALAGPAGIIALIVAAIVGMIANSEKLRDVFKTLWDGIVTVFNGILEILQPVIDTAKMLFDALCGALGAFGDAVATVLGPAIDKIGEVLGPVFQDLVEGVKGVFERVRDAVGSLIQGLSNLKPVLDFIAEIFGTIADVVGPVLAGFLGALVELIGGTLIAVFTALADIIKFVAELFEAISKPVGDFFAFAGEQAKIFREAIDEQIGKVIEWFQGLFDYIKEAMGDPIKALEDAGKAIIEGLKNGIDKAWEDVKKFFGGVIDWIVENKGPVDKDRKALVPAGKAIMEGLKNGASNEWSGLSKWFTDVPGNIINSIGDVGKTLFNKGEDFLNGMKGGATSAWNTASRWFDELPNDVKDTIGDVASTLAGKGNDIIGGLRDGAQGMWSSVQGWFSQLPNSISNSIGNTAWTLYDAGRSIMDGLRSGLESAWSGIQSWVSGLGSWIRDHKGPREYDLKLLIPNGQWIMQSLETGMRSAFPLIERTVGDISDMMAIDQQLSFGGMSNMQRQGVKALPPINVYLDYNAGEDATTLVNDMTSQMALYGYTMGVRRYA